MATDKQIDFYGGVLGASGEEVAALRPLPVEEASSLINAKVNEKIGQLVAGVRIELDGRCGVITSQYVSQGERLARVRWDNGRVASHPVSYYFRSALQGIDQEIAALDALEKKVFTVVWRIVDEHDKELLPNFNVLAVHKKLIGMVQEAHGQEPTDEQIGAIVLQYIEMWRSREQRKWRRR